MHEVKRMNEDTNDNTPPSDNSIPQQSDDSAPSQVNDCNPLDENNFTHQENYNSPLVKCLKCEKQFSNKDNMLRHHAIIHEGRRYACEECNYETVTRRRAQVYKKQEFPPEGGRERKFRFGEEKF